MNNSKQEKLKTLLSVVDSISKASKSLNKSISNVYSNLDTESLSNTEKVEFYKHLSIITNNNGKRQKRKSRNS